MYNNDLKTKFETLEHSINDLQNQNHILTNQNDELRSQLKTMEQSFDSKLTSMLESINETIRASYKPLATQVNAIKEAFNSQAYTQHANYPLQQLYNYQNYQNQLKSHYNAMMSPTPSQFNQIHTKRQRIEPNVDKSNPILSHEASQTGNIINHHIHRTQIFSKGSNYN